MSKEKVCLGSYTFIKEHDDGVMLTVEYQENAVRNRIYLSPETLAALLEYLGVERVGKKEGE